MTRTHDLAGLIDRILAEYREMPGLTLTLKQACRLWGCDEVTCRRALDWLTANGHLCWSEDWRLVAPPRRSSEDASRPNGSPSSLNPRQRVGRRPAAETWAVPAAAALAACG